MHPAKQIIGSSSRELQGKKICLCVCGSLACYRAVDIARELMKRGAEVFPVLSESARAMVSEELFYAATGNKPVARLGGELEHVQLAGKQGQCQAVVVAPATADAVSKLALGICDSTVSTVLATALGSRLPIVFAPAGHDSLFENQFVKENWRKLEKAGVAFVPPVEEGGKSKIASPEEIADYVSRALSAQTLAGKKAVVTAGATREFVDDVRFISNPSSGKMGVALAREAWLRGASVKLVAGHVDVRLPRYLKAASVESVREMDDAVASEKADYFLLAGAPGDFTPAEKKRGKISSGKKTVIELVPARKIRDGIRRKWPEAKLVLFKAESGASNAELEKKARELMKASGADLVVANDVARKGAGFATDSNEVLFVASGKKTAGARADKREIARMVWDAVQ